MRSAEGRFLARMTALVLALTVVVVLAPPALAEDFEDPMFPLSLTPPVAVFGSVEAEPRGVGGAWIDAREAIEPQMSVLLMTGAVNVSPGMTVEVDAGPVFECRPSGS
ncbi:MAG: hypothetical protein GXY85_00755 [Candidatus Brocadiaceae bacterium]|nr:hypothetical protein [Candidatus Brocadiaceae bacterium]